MADLTLHSTATGVRYGFPFEIDELGSAPNGVDPYKGVWHTYVYNERSPRRFRLSWSGVIPEGQRWRLLDLWEQSAFGTLPMNMTLPGDADVDAIEVVFDAPPRIAHASPQSLGPVSMSAIVEEVL